MSRDRPILPVVRAMARGNHWLLWAAAIVAVAAVLLGLALRTWADIEHSVWEGVGTPLRWMLFVVGVATTPALMAPYVAHGVTRRTFVSAAAIAAGGLVAAAACYLAAGYLVERMVFAAAGSPTPPLGNPHLFDSPTQVHLVLMEYGLAFAAFLLGGWLTGTVYSRFGFWRTAAGLPLTLLPIAAVEFLLGTLAWAPWQAPATDIALRTVRLPLGVLASVVVLALALLAVRMLISRVPLNPRLS